MQERKTCFVFHQGKLEEEIEKANEKKKLKKETKGKEEIIQWLSLDCS